MRYAPEAASLWSGSCGVQLSVVVYDKTVDRKRQFIEHSYCFAKYQIIRKGFSLFSNSGIQAGLSTGWGTRLSHFHTNSGKWMITTEVSFVNEYTAIMLNEICLKSNLTFAALNLTFIRGQKALSVFHVDREIIRLPRGQGQLSRIWKVQCDWLSLGKECCSRLSRRLWGGIKNRLP